MELSALDAADILNDLVGLAVQRDRLSRAGFTAHDIFLPVEMYPELEMVFGLKVFHVDVPNPRLGVQLW